MFSMACPPAHPQQYCSTREKQNQRPRELGGQRLRRPRSMTRPRSKAGVAGPHGPLTGAQEALGRHVSDLPIAGVMTQAPGECAPLPAWPWPLPPKPGLTSAHKHQSDQVILPLPTPWPCGEKGDESKPKGWAASHTEDLDSREGKGWGPDGAACSSCRSIQQV